MPLYNDRERHTLFLLEDFPVHKSRVLVFYSLANSTPFQPTQSCERCVTDNLPCVIASFGRACRACERRLDRDCYLLYPRYWREYYRNYGHTLRA